MRLSAVGTSSALLLASAAAAFRDSSPLLVWSSEPNYGLDEAREALTSGVIGADAVFGSLETLGCDWDIVVVVHSDELHQTQIKTMSLPFASSKADLHVPYLIRPTRASLDSSVQSWADKCDAELIDEYATPSEGKRTLVYVSSEKGKDVVLARDMPERNLVIVTGTRSLKERQPRQAVLEEPFASGKVPDVVSAEPSAASADALDLIPSPIVEAAAATTTANKNGTDDGLPKRNTYLTTPIITALLVSFGIFIPIVVMAISALASVQVPPRMLEISKALAVDKGRKDQ